MRRNLNIFIICALLVGAVGVFLAHAATIAAPTLFTATTVTNTKVTLTWTRGQTYIDSCNVIHLSGSDSLFIGGNLAFDATSATLTGLAPGRQYILALRTRSGDSTAVSNKDTIWTAFPQIEANETARNESQWLQGAMAWTPSSIRYDSLYVPDATGLDSTMVYVPWKYTSIQVKLVAPHADSAKVLFRVFAGRAEPTNITWEMASQSARTGTSGKWNFKSVAIDSINVTQNGWSLPKLLAIPVSEHFYITADGQTDNGHTTKALIRLYRNRD